MIPSATELGDSGLLYAALSSPQVTTGCDHMLSAFANRKGLLLAFRNRDERYADIARSGATRPSNPTVQNSPEAMVGHRSWALSSLCVSGHDGTAFLRVETAMGEKAGSLIACQVSAGSDGSDLLDTSVGPGACASRYSGPRELKY